MKCLVCFVLLALCTSRAIAIFGSDEPNKPAVASQGQLKHSASELEDALRKIQAAQQEIAQQKDFLSSAGEPGIFQRIKSTLTPAHGYEVGQQPQVQQPFSGLAESLREKAQHILPSASDAQSRLSHLVEQAKGAVGSEPTMGQKLKEMMGGHVQFGREPTLAERAGHYAESVKERISEAMPGMPHVPSSVQSMMSPKPQSLKDRIAEKLKYTFGYRGGEPESAQQRLQEAWDTTKFKAQGMFDSLRRPVYETAGAYGVSGQLPSWVGPRHYNAVRQMQLVEASLPKDDSNVKDYLNRLRSLVDHLGREEMKYNELKNLRSNVKSDGGWTWYFHSDSRLKVDEINTLLRDTERTMESIEDDFFHMLKEVKPFIGLGSRMFIRDVFKFVPDVFRVLGETIAGVFGLGLFSFLVGGPTLAALLYGISYSFGPQLFRLLAGVPAFGIASWWLLKLPAKIIEYNPNWLQFLAAYVPLAGGLIALAAFAGRAIFRAVSMSEAEARAKLQQAKKIAQQVLPAGAAPVSSLLPEGQPIEGQVKEGVSSEVSPPTQTVSSATVTQSVPPSLDTTGRPASGVQTRHRQSAVTAH